MQRLWSCGDCSDHGCGNGDDAAVLVDDDWFSFHDKSIITSAANEVIVNSCVICVGGYLAHFVILVSCAVVVIDFCLLSVLQQLGSETLCGVAGHRFRASPT